MTVPTRSRPYLSALARPCFDRSGERSSLVLDCLLWLPPLAMFTCLHSWYMYMRGACIYGSPDLHWQTYQSVSCLTDTRDRRTCLSQPQKDCLHWLSSISHCTGHSLLRPKPAPYRSVGRQCLHYPVCTAQGDRSDHSPPFTPN